MGSPAVVMLRDVEQADLPIFFEHQREPDANRMAAFPAREWDAFFAHWREKVLATRAREFVAARAASLPAATATAIGWNCYRHPAYDLAYPLFAAAFAANMRNIKFLRAIETAADRVGKRPELIELFEQHAPDHKPLYGRARALRLRTR